ncbi:MAG: hypothetical protein JWN38_1253 [Candidatus Saccharibacteria bacterium]|nr:hypothetical protein [Candidatus Saccharibacteria bacterium]
MTRNKFEYIDHSFWTLNAIDKQALASVVLGKPTATGSTTEFHPLGRPWRSAQATSTRRQLHIGFKTGLPGCHTEAARRLQVELPFFALLADRVPDLRMLLPNFLGRLTIGGLPAGILTEDASFGGSRRVTPSVTSAATRRQLATVFCSKEDPAEAVFYSEPLNNSFASIVAGHERLLDATPLPVLADKVELLGLTEYQQYVIENLGALTVDLPPDSPFSRSLGERRVQQ